MNAEAVTRPGSGGDDERHAEQRPKDPAGVDRGMDAIGGAVRLIVGLAGMAAGVWVLLSLPAEWPKSTLVMALVVLFLALGAVGGLVMTGARALARALWPRREG